MSRDKAIGAGLLVGSIAVIAVYAWLVWFPLWEGIDMIILKLTGTVAVAAVFGILAWIGYTLATTPPPKPIEEIEKEIEEELKRLEKEMEESGEKGSEGGGGGV